MITEAFRIGEEVQEAMATGQGVVALETAVLTHGLPYPDNLETMKDMTQAVRAEGAVPAVIGVVHGRVTAGLTSEQWEQILETPQKCSVRDLPMAAVQQKNGGTTVAATLFVAHACGISVAATGGIGGVHRGWQQTLDISADLSMLAHSPSILVCSGAKSILDIPATMEYLETAGVMVVGYQTQSFPGFYLPATNFPLEYTIEDPKEAAQIYVQARALGVDAGLLVLNPSPVPIAVEMMDSAIARALREADQQHIRGKQVTPFLLDAINREHQDTLESANRALLIHNARLAAKVALQTGRR